MEMKTRTNQPVQGDELENLEVSGELKAFENIVDEDGHKRFIEGDITMTTTTGITQTFGKWSLSGSHLLIVLGFDMDAGDYSALNLVNAIDLPDWVKDNIVALYQTIVDNKVFAVYNDDYSSQNIGVTLQKSASGVIFVYLTAVSITKTRHARVSFDLLIE